MKKLLFVLVGFMMASCVPMQYCQLYQTKPIDNIQIKDNTMCYEDENCVITYDFWREYGEMGFVFYNKSSENLYLHLDECFFVANGFAYDYYQNRTYTNSRMVSAGVVNAANVQGGFAPRRNAVRNANESDLVLVPVQQNMVVGSTSKGVSIAEKPVICIPPHTSKVVSEFSIKSQVYRNCDLLLNPVGNDPNSLSFNKDNTPLTFGNRIAYSKGESENMIRINNDFYVSKITNYDINKISSLEFEEICGEKQLLQVRKMKESGPDQFYIWYPRNAAKH